MKSMVWKGRWGVIFRSAFTAKARQVFPVRVDDGLAGQVRRRVGGATYGAGARRG
jgi:hypothetical protein